VTPAKRRSEKCTRKLILITQDSHEFTNTIAGALPDDFEKQILFHTKPGELAPCPRHIAGPFEKLRHSNTSQSQPIPRLNHNLTLRLSLSPQKLFLACRRDDDCPVRKATSLLSPSKQTTSEQGEVALSTRSPTLENILEGQKRSTSHGTCHIREITGFTKRECFALRQGSTSTSGWTVDTGQGSIWDFQ
jgi:hypothetical protein